MARHIAGQGYFQTSLVMWAADESRARSDIRCVGVERMNENHSDPFGFNVIGLASGNLGLGRAVRELIRALLARGELVRVLDTAVHDQRGSFDNTYGELSVRDPIELPFSVNVSVISAPTLYKEAMWPLPGLRLDARLNVAYVWWEVAEMPEYWCFAARAFDVLLAGSDFVAAVLRARIPGVPVIVMRHACEIPAGIKADRVRFGLPVEGFWRSLALIP